jgi:hypothetical protein
MTLSPTELVPHYGDGAHIQINARSLPLARIGGDGQWVRLLDTRGRVVMVATES